MSWEQIDATAGGAPDVPRDRWGRPLITPPEGGKPVAYTRCTTFVGALEDTYNLMAWKQRQTAAGLCQRKDLHLQAASLGLCPDDEGGAKVWKQRMNEVCEQAMEAAGSTIAATTGTALHVFTEALDRGEKIPNIPGEFAQHITNYKKATTGLHPVAIEQFLVCDRYKVGGTADRILRIDGEDGLFIGDLKTGTIDFPHKMAMQLAMYAHSEIYNWSTGERSPIDGIRQDKGLIIALNAKTGACELVWIDIASGWEAVQLAALVREWRARKNLTAPATIGNTLPTAPVAATPKRRVSSKTKIDEWLAMLNKINNAPTVNELMAVTEQLKTDGVWNKEMQAAARNRWADLQDQPPF